MGKPTIIIHIQPLNGYIKIINEEESQRLSCSFLHWHQVFQPFFPSNPSTLTIWHWRDHEEAEGFYHSLYFAMNYERTFMQLQKILTLGWVADDLWWCEMVTYLMLLFNGGLRGIVHRQRDILCRRTFNIRTVRLMSLVFRPRFICPLPAHETDVTCEAHTPVIIRRCRLVIEACSWHRLGLRPSIKSIINS